MRVPKLYLAIATGLLALAPPAMASGPSFACARATTADERAICHSAALSAQDRELAGYYPEIKACSGMRGEGIQEDQTEWLAQRRACGADRACLRKIYSARLVPFRRDAAKARRAQRRYDCPIF